MKKFLILLFFAWLPSAQGAGEIHAVVRLPSHGASATVIDTGPGYTWILGCGHAYEGNSANKPMIWDLPTAHPNGEPKKVGSRLVKLDRQNDLSLVLLNEGPVDFKCPVGYVGWNLWKDNVQACGYDSMKTPSVKAPAHIISEEGTTFYTRERPIPGRSGGGLIDLDKGILVGVCQGYELAGPRRGMYISLPTIQRFLQNATQPKQAPQLPLQQPIWQPRGRTPNCPPGGS